ncbi:transcriptional regulator [Roseobacter sp. SK209-2-6]|uniref:LysR substrate-binding domain-containing protein n=1 Tax=Roseobacter sp. SK209-2-6 TaxID=388739 RepID=UPI0000F3D779|nr:LysR substrate-binding domain-containing protein [Roseobacter sp. SK209-2-6]EBA17290.1 transcriptional regulator [Roseobacter sp. SK209-2-6]
MQELWKLVTSPRHLIVFEAAARLGSFTRAAEELNVQQPAVSASVKQLELSLGVQLFLRSHKKVVLTAAGQRLFADVARALEQLLVSARSVQQLARRDYVTLNASSAFNNYWMMPRLADLHAAHPGIDLRLQSSDREPDIDAENISLAVRRGDGNWPGCEAELIAQEAIYPVAAPRLVSGLSADFTLSDLPLQRLIHLEEPIRDRPTWQQWFGHFGLTGLPLEGGLRLNDYALVLQAAMAGEGFAFGWKHVTDPLVTQGLLAAKRDWVWESGRGFYLVWSRKSPLGPEAEKVRDWILDRVQADMAAKSER